MTLEDSVDFFVHESCVMASLDLCCGNTDRTWRALGGALDMEGARITRDSLYGLASLTKLMTGTLVMSLYEQGCLDLGKPVTAYASQFEYLKEVTVDQLLGFEVNIQTPERIDRARDRETAVRALFAARAMPHTGSRMYSDIHAMIMKYVIQAASGRSYMECLKTLILNPLGMKRTYCLVPDSERIHCASCDREHRIEGNRWILREGIEKGTPHDPKCRMLNLEGNDCPGHAGLFSCMEDMEKFCRGMLDGKLLSEANLERMSRNRTGRKLADGTYTQYLGSQCYVRHPEQVHSEVPVFMSDSSMAVSGFTGHHLSLDPVSHIFEIALGNRVLNRLTVLVPPEGKNIQDYGLDERGQGWIEWTDGERIRSSVRYVYLRDAHMHNAAQQVLGYHI